MLSRLHTIHMRCATMAVSLSLFAFVSVVFGRYTSIPAPTVPGHQSRSTSPPAATSLALLRRDDPPLPLTNSKTCGYTRGLWSSAVTCADQYTCNYFTEPYSAPNFGCCSSDVGCEYMSTCYDYGHRNNPNTAGGVLVNGGDEEFYCGSDQPYCSTLVLYGQEYASGGTYSFLSYNCITGSARTATAYQSTRDSTTSQSATTSSTSSESSSTTSSTTSSTSATSSPSSTTSAPNPPPSSAATTTPESSNGLSQGAQIGIGVGIGIAIAGALLAASLWLWRRRKERAAPTSHAHHGQYEDTPTEIDSSPGAMYDSYAQYDMHKQSHQHSAPVEMQSGNARHELDGGFSQELPLVGNDGESRERR